MNTDIHSATGEGRADDPEFTMYLTMSARCAMNIWQLEGDADLAMRMLARALYAPTEMPELDPLELAFKWKEIGENIEANPMPVCSQCTEDGVAILDEISYCWDHYTTAMFDTFTRMQSRQGGLWLNGDDGI